MKLSACITLSELTDSLTLHTRDPLETEKARNSSLSASRRTNSVCVMKTGHAVWGEKVAV